MCIKRHIQRSEWGCLGESPMRNSPRVGKMKTPTHQTWLGGIRKEQRDDGAHAPMRFSYLIMTVREWGCHLLLQTCAHWKKEMSTAHLPPSPFLSPWEPALPLTLFMHVFKTIAGLRYAGVLDEGKERKQEEGKRRRGTEGGKSTQVSFCQLDASRETSTEKMPQSDSPTGKSRRHFLGEMVVGLSPHWVVPHLGWWSSVV